MKDQTLVSELVKEIMLIDRKITRLNEQLAQDYIYHFEWGKPEQLYSQHVKKRMLTSAFDFVSENPTRAAEWLAYNIEDLTKGLLRGKYRGTSSNTFANLGVVNRKEVEADVLELYKRYHAWITDEKDPIQVS